MGKKRYSDKSDRDRDLYEAFKVQLDKARYPFLLTDVLEATVKSPAPRFYMSARRALEIITDIRGGNPPPMSDNKERMVRDIMTRLEVAENDNPGTSTKHLLEAILDQPAPEFYLKPTSAKTILCNEKRRQKHAQRMRDWSRMQRIERRKEQKLKR